jgi:hypothetical protein
VYGISTTPTLVGAHHGMNTMNNVEAKKKETLLPVKYLCKPNVSIAQCFGFGAGV